LHQEQTAIRVVQDCLDDVHDNRRRFEVAAGPQYQPVALALVLEGGEHIGVNVVLEVVAENFAEVEMVGLTEFPRLIFG
jgi:hypothetical protein